MSRNTSKHVVILVVMMLGIAVVIYWPSYEQRSTAEITAVVQQVAQNAAAEHAQFLTRYVDTTIVRQPGVKTVGVALEFQNGKGGKGVEDALIRRLQTGTVRILPSFFKPSFISDGLFDSALNGSGDVLQQLDLARSLDELLLVRESVEFSTNGADLENVITATIRLDITLLTTVGESAEQTWSFTAAGSGFSQTGAQAMAEERLIKQIADDKKMSI